MENENITGYTCTTCGKVFETKEEFDNRHKKKKNKLVTIYSYYVDFLLLTCKFQQIVTPQHLSN
jgi:transposase-like protein